jgi:hypothetical protein
MALRRFTQREGKHDAACLTGTPTAPAPNAPADFSVHLTEPSAWGGEVDVDIRTDATEFPGYNDPTFVPVAVWSECKALRTHGWRGSFHISVASSSDQLRVRRRPGAGAEPDRIEASHPYSARPTPTKNSVAPRNPEHACATLHTLLEHLPVFDHTTTEDKLPAGPGIYFFYQDIGGAHEASSHKGEIPGIVRVGISSGTGTRISHHYRGVIPVNDITLDTFCPKDRSVMRKHIGRALLNTLGHPHSDYLGLWEVDLTKPVARQRVRKQRRVEAEKAVEGEVSEILQKTFRFRCLAAPSSEVADRWETQCIGILASCPTCSRSQDWLGRHHPNPVISRGKLWNVQKVDQRYSGPWPFDELSGGIKPGY